MRFTLIVLAIAVSGLPVLSVAQTAQKPTFEVASIKQAAFPNDAYFNGYSSVGPCAAARLSTSGNRVTLVQASICGLIGTAYDFRDYLVMGGPDWIRSVDRSIYYDILASAPDSKDTLRATEPFNLASASDRPLPPEGPYREKGTAGI